LSKKNKRMIEQAAAISGQSLSDFAVTSLVRAAQEKINEETATILSNRDRDIFLKMLESDARPNEALRAAAKRYRDRRA